MADHSTRGRDPNSQGAYPPILDNRLSFWLGVHVARGHDAEAIADLLSVPGCAGEVSQLAADWGRPVEPIPQDEVIGVSAHARARTCMAREARARGLMLPELASRTLIKVAEDDLWAAILDD